MYRNFIERDHPALYHSPSDDRCTHLVHNDGKSYKVGSQTLNFDTFYPVKSFSLEAWVYPTHLVGRSRLLAFDDENGLLLEPGKVMFLMGVNAVSYTFTPRIMHVVATYTSSEMTLYINGETVGSLLVSPQAGVRKSNLYTSSNSTSRIFATGLAAYHSALTPETVKNHYDLGVNPDRTLFQSVSSTAFSYYEFNYDAVNAANIVTYGDGNWPGLSNNVNTNNSLQSTYVDDAAQEGSWQFSYFPEEGERTLTITWEGNGTIQQLRGSSWSDLKPNDPVQLSGETTFRVYLPAGVAVEVTSLTVRVYSTIYVNDFAIGTGTTPGEYFYPTSAVENSGIVGSSGTVKLTDAYSIKAYSGWFRHDGVTSQFDSPAGKLFINGVERGWEPNFDRNKWVHVVKVFDSASNAELNLKVTGAIGVLVTHDEEPDALALYNNFFTITHRFEEPQSVDIKDVKPSIYGHDWTVHSV